MFRRLSFFVLLAFIAAGAVNAQQLLHRGEAYRIHQSDVVALHFRLTPEFDQTVTVDPNGDVYLQGLDSVHAAGYTVQQFREQVIQAAAARLVKPEVSITLKEFDKPHIYVGGEVNSPGRFDIRSDISALDAIALAGGFKDSSQKSRILLLRKNPDGSATVTQVLNLKEAISQRKLQEVAQLHSGDILYVTQNRFSKLEKSFI